MTAAPRNWNNFALGLFVALVPLLGIPGVIKTILLVVVGLLIALFSLVRFTPPVVAEKL